ncbi:MAG: GDP-mannose 4,6-dehydratase [Ignavibacteriales bacterium]|nr:GDP-mannose 4,6-dehydratase [Ignavibacteriales bacterium]
MENALIFGANGQDGYYLAEVCKYRGIDPIRVSRTDVEVQADVSKLEQVEDLMKKYQPTFVFHLAANSTTRYDALFENFETISRGTLNVLEAAKRYSPKTKVFITGSGVQFKNVGKPISECDDFEANSPYGMSRIQSVYAARYYRSIGIRTYVGYLFHHESPLRKPHHVSQKIAMAVRRITRGHNEILELGDITVVKEWTFARDVAEGILTLLLQEDIFEAAIGSGKGYSIENWLQLCFGLIDRDWRNFVRPQKDFISEYSILVSNPSTMNRLGWQASVPIDKLAKMMIQSSPLLY